ncbi:MAG: hypothetical protein HY432_01130 [Candidatus Liptonbacteria bacterium]|nr:hypothetical protein [Candidatus Liptonbacteria bacterium]
MRKNYSRFLFASVSISAWAVLFFAVPVFASSVNISASIPSVCGNGVFDTGEQCDDTALGGQSCVSQGYSGGTLGCKADCTFDTSACTVGGGGGSGVIGVSRGYFISPTQVVFSGRAYPSGKVTLLKDAQIAATTIAGNDALFQVTLSNISAGNYIFSFYGEDKSGVRSSLLTFPVSVIDGTTTNVSGIFIAPTIKVDKEEVKKGDDIIISGQSSPQSDIVITISPNQKFFGKTTSDKDGVYSYNLDTTMLDYGSYSAKSRASIGNLEISGYGNIVNFIVGTKNVPAKQQVSCSVLFRDLNGDCRVDLVDFSIVAYWYGRHAPPDAIDLNGDGKVTIVDFSIIAYYWTG